MLLKWKKKLRILFFDRRLIRFINKNLTGQKRSKLRDFFDQFLYRDRREECCDAACEAGFGDYSEFHEADSTESQKLDELIAKLKKPTFTEELIRLIRESGKKDSEIYKAADVDKRLFSKIMSDSNYKPSKDTAIALSLALRLSFDEMIDLISRAGYTITHSSKRDLIIEFFFKKKQYRLIELNDALYRFGEKPLGRTK